MIISILNCRRVWIIGKNNPITGQHVEVEIELDKNSNKSINEIIILGILKNVLPKHKVPARIIVKERKLSHRYKKLQNFN